MRCPVARPPRRGVSRKLSAAAGAGLIVLALGAIGDAGAVPRAEPDSRWAPWLGCWELSPDPDAPVPAAPPAIRMCVTQVSRDGGVRISTTVEGTPGVEETLVADGAEWPIEDGSCHGVRRAEWSQNGRRLFSRAQVQCTGAPPHAVSHLATIVGGTWIDIQAITREAHEALRVRRYRRVDAATAPAVTSPPGVAPETLSIDEIKEASAKVSPLVLQAALVETRARYRLDGRTMIELDRAGVPDEVTDLMVALSYPDRFRVRRPVSTGYATGVFGWFDYDPFAYWGWGSDDYWESDDVVIIGPPGGGGQPADRGGRVVNGRGYTRIEPQPSNIKGSRDSGDRSSSTASTESPSSSDSGSSSSGVSSQGYSGGESSGGSDRTAQPRPPR